MTCAHPKSPFEAFMEFKPIVGHFQPWKVSAFALKHKSKKDLLERVKLCLHVGCLSGQASSWIPIVSASDE